MNEPYQSKESCPRRVLVIHNIQWAHYKAAVFEELFRLGRSRGFEVFVIHMAQTQDARSGMPGADAELHRYPHKVLFEGSFNDTSAFDRSWMLIRGISKYRPNIIVVPGYDDPAYWAALFFGRLAGAHIIASVDSTFNDHPRRWFRELPKRFFLGRCDAVFGYGKRSREYCNYLGVPSERVFVRCQATQNAYIRKAYLAFSAEAKKYPERRRTFGYIGRLSEEKNLPMLLQAYQALFADQALEPWRLLLVGAGPQESELRLMAMRTPHLPIEFAGGVSWREVPQRIAEMDVVVLPSRSEPWGLVVNEAMLCERPIIVSTTCGCIPELVKDGVNGYSFEPNDLPALKRRMSEFAEDPEKAREMGLRGLEIISDFTPEVAAAQMVQGLEFVDNRR